MSAVLATLALSALLAWAALPLLAWAARLLARRSAEALDPAAYERALFAALGFAVLLFLAPWIRLASVYATVLCDGLQLGARDARAPATPAIVAGSALLLAMLLGVVRRGRELLLLRRLSEQAEPAPPWLTALVSAAAGRLAVAPPEVRISARAQVPCLIGVRRARMLLPAELLGTLERSSLELVVLHELAHLRRKDTARALAAAGLALPFTGHPAARWLLSELALAREIAVDLLVGPLDPRRYAGLLLEVAAGVRRGATLPPVAMAVSQVEQRIHRLAAQASPGRGRVGPMIALGASLVAGALAAPTSSAEVLAPAVARAACAASPEHYQGVPAEPSCDDQSCDPSWTEETCDEVCASQ